MVLSRLLSSDILNGNGGGRHERPPLRALLSAVLVTLLMSSCTSAAVPPHARTPLNAGSHGWSGPPPAGIAQWLYHFPADSGQYHPVSWLDGSVQSVLATPNYPGGSGADLWPSPDGELLIAQQKDGIDQAIDWQGHRFTFFDNRGFYQWADDSRHLCATVDTGTSDVTLLLIDLVRGAVRTVARVPRDHAGDAIHAYACSLKSRLAVIAEVRSSSRGALVSSVMAYDITSGRRVSFYDYSGTTSSFVVASPDGHLFAISDRTHATPAVVRDVRSGATLSTIADRWIITLGAAGAGMVTVGETAAGNPLVETRDSGAQVTWSAQGVVDDASSSPIGSGFAILLYPHGRGSQSAYMFVRPDGSAKLIVTGAIPV